MSDNHAGHHDENVTRRDFLYIATGAAGVIAVGGIAWPLVAQMGPNDREKAAGAPVEVDVSAIEPGMQIVIIWRGAPYFIRHLTEQEVAAAKEAGEGEFRDFVAADTRLARIDDQEVPYTIVSASCTHLGCVPTKVDTGLNGWVCPCHGSIFDVTGRVIKGPAATNLPLPPYAFASAEQLVLGAETAGA